MKNGIETANNSEDISKGVANLKQLLESNGASDESAKDICNRFDVTWDHFLEKTTFKDRQGNELSPESIVLKAKHDSPDYFGFGPEAITHTTQGLSDSFSQHVIDKMAEGYEPNINELKSALKDIYSRKIETVTDQANFMKSYRLCRKHLNGISNWSFLNV